MASVPKLSTSLKFYLIQATELYVSVALMKDYGLNFIMRNVRGDCEIKLLLGVDLPTSPSVFRAVLELEKENSIFFSSKVYESRETYHPKVYLMKLESGKWVALVGSGNATKGGLNSNIEMTVEVHDQQVCNNLLQWFKSLFAQGIIYDDAKIIEYEKTYKRNLRLASTQKSNLDDLKGRDLPIRSDNIYVPSGQFFTQNDFDAFAPITHHQTNGNAVTARRVVRDRLLELNNNIFPRFFEFGIADLHLPSRKNNYTSQHFHSRGNDHNAKNAIWLNYGKSLHQLNKYPVTSKQQNFLNHARIQIILRNTVDETYIGFWLVVGKNNGGRYDRQNLKNQLSNRNFVGQAFEYLEDLGGAYRVSLGNNTLNIGDMSNEDMLVQFLLQDNYSNYFIIGRNYQPDDKDLSDENIFDSVLTEFSKLYKIYDLFRDKR